MKKSFILLIVSLLVNISCLYAAKIDTLYLRNGDRIIGEIKSLDLGFMSFKTDDIGTLSVKWQRIAHLVSPQYFEVEISSGRKYYCSIGKTDKVGEIVLLRGEDSTIYDVKDVVYIVELERKFIDRLKGTFQIGANYANSTKIGAVNGGANLELRNEKSFHKLSYNVTYSQDNYVQNQRQEGNYSYNRYLHNSWFATFGETYQQNSEQGLVGRLSTEIGLGRSFLHTNTQFLNLTVGASASREWSNENTAQTTSEGIIDFYYNRFRIIGNTLDLRAGTTVYPSITVNRRYRIDISINLNWEIFDDFILAWNYYYNYDSKPLSESAVKEDWGFTTSIGYSL